MMNKEINRLEVIFLIVTKFLIKSFSSHLFFTCSQVYYLTCPEVTAAYAHFPTTPTGSEVTSIEQATGKCVAHSRVDANPVHLCTGDGKWSLLSGGCVCLPGYQAHEEHQTCEGKEPNNLVAPKRACILALHLIEAIYLFVGFYPQTHYFRLQ